MQSPLVVPSFDRAATRWSGEIDATCEALSTLVHASLCCAPAALLTGPEEHYAHHHTAPLIREMLEPCDGG